MPPDIRFFTPAEEAIATALCDQLLDQHDGAARCPVVDMIDARLAEQQTDGWHYDDMPADGAGLARHAERTSTPTPRQQLRHGLRGVLRPAAGRA